MSETAERELFECLYQENKDAFLSEWERKRSLENTANTYLTVYSVILGFSFLKLEEFLKVIDNKSSKFSIVYWLIFMIGISAFYCIIRGLWQTIKSVTLQGYRSFPEPNELLEKMQDKSKLAFLKTLSKDFAKSVNMNEKENNKKAQALQSSCNFLKGTIIFICLVVFCIMFLKFLGG